MAKESSVKECIISSIKSPSFIHTTLTVAWNGSPQIAKKSGLQRSTSEIDLGWSREERAAIRIQAAYRGYLAKQDFCVLKALVKLQIVFGGYLVRRQVHLALHRIEILMSLQHWCDFFGLDYPLYDDLSLALGTVSYARDSYLS